MTCLNENSSGNGSNVNSLIGQGLPKEDQGEETRSDTVKLISCDNKEFKIERKIAYQAAALKKMLETPDGSENEVTLENILGYCLEIVCEFLNKKGSEKLPENWLEQQFSKEFYTFVNEIDACIPTAEDSTEEKQKNSTTLYVKVISCDGKEFKIPRKVAYRSITLKNMLDVQNGTTDVVKLDDIRGGYLDIALRYLEFKVENPDEGNRFDSMESFKKELDDLVTKQDVMEMLMIAHFLDC
ncbi:hypothetical protein QYM36_015956 [Artemia franciscana]|uniref:Elongin-C n=1 Tax=Artemia franciscana TaxID=6661 RepID=A0AA88KW04_ARTSF|nr:hypothetical protein QYM36_015956 [Artemia franciscana]